MPNNLYKQVFKNSLRVPCVVLERVEIEDYSGDVITTVEVVQGNKYTHSCIGRHLIDPTEREIVSAVNEVDVEFSRIYVYGSYTHVKIGDK